MNDCDEKMKLIKLFALLIVGCGWFFPVQSSADNLTTGTWIGTYSKIDENDVTVVEYEVQKTSDNPAHEEKYKITLDLHDEPFDFEDLEVTNGKLKFLLNLGEPVTCLLSKKDGVFKGVCSQENDEGIKPCFKLTMKPPTENAE